MKVNDSKQVYTIPETSLTDIVDKNISDFYSLTVNYLTVNNLETVLKFSLRTELIPYRLQEKPQKIQKTVRKKAPDPRKKRVPVTLGKLLQIKIKKMKMQRKILLMKRPGLQKRENIHVLDGKEIEETVFTTFYNKLINMAGQERLTEEIRRMKVWPLPLFSLIQRGDKTTVSYYEYDSSFYAAVTGDKVYLVNKMDIRDLTDAYQEMLNTDSSEESQEESDP